MPRRYHPALFLAVLTMTVLQSRAADGTSTFQDKIEPILAKHCYECHSEKAEKVKGGLRLDTKAGILKGGDTGQAIIPGDVDNSRIIIAIRHKDPDLQMPPKKKISDDEIAALEEWVKAGAPDPRTDSTPDYKTQKELWSAKPVQSPAPPVVKGSARVKDPVDAFVLSALEKQGIEPVAPADVRTLIRRASFDLLGLPPSPNAVDKLISEDGEKAYERFVDEALQSPHFGERWGRHWLDLARYADSNGPDNTRFENAWRYRNWVINAFNNDKPYDEFVREQIAGDLLKAENDEDRHQKWIATGFLMLGPKNFFEPNREKLLMDIADEQIDVTSRAILGLTVSCARCHDHKFDPIPTRDYYALAGIFRSTQTLSSPEGGGRRGGATPFSERSLGTAEQAAAFEKYEAELAKLERKRDAARRMAQELPGGIDSKELDGIVLDNLQAEVIGDWVLSNYSTNFVDKNYLHDGNDRRGKGKKSIRFRPDVPQQGDYEIRLAYTARPNRATNVPVKVEGKSTRTVYLNQQVLPPHDKAFESLGVFELEKGTNNLVEVLTEGTKGFVVVDAIQLIPQDVTLAGSLMKRRAQPEPAEAMVMEQISAVQFQEIAMQLMDLTANPPAEIAQGLPRALAVKDAAPANVKIHIRGDPERLGEEVPRGFLSVIEHVESGKLGTDSSGRLELANWIADNRNPLTARVAVNRIWMHLFGRGLVNTPDNFGSVGDRPSNPELLDYLASEFMLEGWSHKRMIRRLMLSSTYRLSTAQSDKALAVDPENQLYWRMNRKRLDAESLRDSMLALNGTLDRAVGGEGTSNAMTPAERAAGDALENSSRRSVYLPVLRGNVNELFRVFDFPDPSALAGKRFVTTAPTQALYLMNSPFASEQSRAWATNLVGDTGKSDAEIIEQAYRAAYNRVCTSAEQARAEQFLKNFERSLVQLEPDPTKRRARTFQAFCQAIYQSTEFRFLN